MTCCDEPHAYRRSRAASLLALAAVAAPAHAEPDNLGGYKLGQKQKLKLNAKPKKLSIYGCEGEVVPTVVKGVVTSVTFTQEMETICGGEEDMGAEREALIAAIRTSPRFGRSPDKPWAAAGTPPTGW